MPGQNLTIDEARLALLPPAARDKAVKALRELETARKQNPLLFYNNPDPMVGLPPHPKQPLFHGFTPAPLKRFIFLGGNQSGKTTGGATDCLIQSIDKRMVPEHLRPYRRYPGNNFRCWVAAPGWEQIEDYIFEKIQEWVPPSELEGGSWRAAYDSQHHTLTFKHAQWTFKTYEQEINKWGGKTLDCVWFDEEPPKAHYGEGRIRVGRKEGYLLFTMTPTEGLTHMFEEFQVYVEKAEARATESFEDERAGVVLVDMDDNALLTETAKREMLAGFSREERAARKSGKFVALHGLIYGDYDRQEHELPALEPNEAGEYAVLNNTNVVVGIDPGIRNAAAVLWSCFTPDNEMVCFEELHLQNMTTAAVCERIHKVNAHYNIKPLYYVIDPASKNRQSQTGRSDQEAYAENGVVALAGQNDVRAGINKVKTRFQHNKLFICENCENLKKELTRYRWKKPPRTEDGAKEIPVKKDDHLMDALRYIAMQRPWLPEIEEKNNETAGQKKMREDIEQYTQPLQIPVA